MIENNKIKTDICVMKTMDHNLFDTIDGNRQINPRNVEIIKTSMTEKQLIVPVIVNEKMQIIDGQHRVASCAALGLPVYYIVVEGYNLDDVQRINADMKSWDNKDFLDSFINRYEAGSHQYIEYVRLRDFAEQNGIPLATAMVASDFKKSKPQIIKDFKKGKFIFKKMQVAQTIINAARDFNQYDTKVWKKAGFIKVFASLFLNERYIHDTMMKNVPKKMSLLAEMGNDLSIRTHLIRIYNTGTNRQKKLYEDSIIDAWKDMLERAE